MSKSKLIWLYLIFFIVLSFLVGKYFYFWFQKKSYLNYLEKKTLEIYNSLSWHDRISLLFHVGLADKGLTKKNQEILETFRPGGLILFAHNLGSPIEIAEFTKALQEFSFQKRGLPLWISTDQEGGFVKRVFLEEIDFPSAFALGKVQDKNLCGIAGFLTSYHLANLGINLFFAPVLDINNNFKNPVIGMRSFGTQVIEVLDCAISYEKKAREAQTLPVVKHFPGHGDTDRDSHLELPIIRKSWQELEKFELLPFKEAIHEGSKAIMVGHILFPQVDPVFPSSLSYEILTNKLQKEMGFRGLIITDALEMKALSKFFQEGKLATAALLAGADILLLTSYGSYAQKLWKELHEAFEQKKIPPKVIEKSAKKQIYYLLQYTPSSYLKDLPSLAEKYLVRLKKEQSETFSFYQKNYPNLPSLLAQKSLRSLGNKFSQPFAFENTFFAIENKIIWETILEFYVGKNLKNNPKGRKIEKESFVITDSFSQRDLNQISEWAKKNPSKNFMVLHYGQVFLNFPKEKNIYFILSLSPNPTALKELAKAPFQRKEYPQLELFHP